MVVIVDPLPRVTDVRHVRDHVLWLRFADGVEGQVDFAGRLQGALLGPLSDVGLFARARVDDGFVVWPNGADSAPEALYERVLAANGISSQAIDDAWAAQLAYIARLPEISRFFGIVITMLADDHSSPHFHAKYDEHAISVIIRNGEIVGRFPSRALRLVLEWRELHEAELIENWNRLQGGLLPEPIQPLD